MLRLLLEKLMLQEVNEGLTFSIVIIDNDSNRSALKLVNEFKNLSEINIIYDCEENQNISLARNKAVKNAKGDFIAFIDDDEIPINKWLLNLMRAYKKFNADGIQGPVYPIYNKETPKWVKRGKFYERPPYKDGQILNWRQGRTGNLFIHRNIFKNNPNIFDSRFGSGGEDQDFFRRTIEKGFVFKYCNNAIVYEHLPAIRWNKKFMIKRALLRGKSALNYQPKKLAGIIKSIVAVIFYTFSLPVVFILNHSLYMKYLIKIFDHLGKILGLFNLNLVKEKYVTS